MNVNTYLLQISNHLNTMQVLPIQFELIETQGFFIVAVYIHYFAPGSLKLHTHVQFLSSDSFEDIFGSEHTSIFENSRRWLQVGESPYPGYCRAPGSSVCKPVLCNCVKLLEIWNTLQDNTMKSKKKKARK